MMRLLMYYPMNVGRNMDEIKRALVALQTSDEQKCPLPVDWRPGDMAIVPPPKTLEQLEARNADTQYEKVDFYLARKPI